MAAENESKTEQSTKREDAPIVMQADADRFDEKSDRLDRQPQYDAFMRIIRR